MRLACPNCDARYEVPDDAIPEGGRDVQCSNCGYAWLQHPGASSGPTALPAGGAARVAPGAATAGLVAAEEEDLRRALRDDMPEAGPAPVTEAGAPDEAAVELPQRPPISDEVLAVLREEASREAEARRREALMAPPAQPVEGMRAPLKADPSAPLLPQGPGLRPPAAEPRVKATERPRPAGGGPAPRPAENGRPGSRRDLLPDVEEISSTLRPEAEPPGGAAAPSPAARHGGAFRFGFWLALLVIVALVVAYVYAPQIARQWPETKAYLSDYVTTVDQFRQKLQDTIAAIRQFIWG